MVDFLLYLKRRSSSYPPLDLPSHFSPLKQSQYHSLHTAPLVHIHNSAHYATLQSQSPASLSVDDGKPGAYDYNPDISLLHKLRDTQLLFNFTCNEHVMIQLLDYKYIEYLENAALNTNDQ